jgi:hypothetical protein
MFSRFPFMLKTCMPTGDLAYKHDINRKLVIIPIRHLFLTGRKKFWYGHHSFGHKHLKPSFGTFALLRGRVVSVRASFGKTVHSKT